MACASFAESRARRSCGIAIPAMTPMIAMTISSSMRVNPAAASEPDRRYDATGDATGDAAADSRGTAPVVGRSAPQGEVSWQHSNGWRRGQWVS